MAAPGSTGSESTKPLSTKKTITYAEPNGDDVRHLPEAHRKRVSDHDRQRGHAAQRIEGSRFTSN